MTEMDKMPFSFTTSSDIGILISHGYTSVPGSFRYIGEKLYGLGFNVECPLLTGHGSDWKTLNSVKYETWVADLETALEKTEKPFENHLRLRTVAGRTADAATGYGSQGDSGSFADQPCDLFQQSAFETGRYPEVYRAADARYRFRYQSPRNC